MSGYYVSQKVRHDDGAVTYHLSFARTDGSIAATAGTVTEHPRGIGIWVRNEYNEQVEIGSKRSRAMRTAVVNWLRA